MNEESLNGLILQALKEDVGPQDVTTELTVPENARCTARLIAKQDGVLSGMTPFRLVFDHTDSRVTDWDSREDGAPFTRGDTLAEFSGNTRGILTGERTALNFLQHLTGVASLTAQFVKAIEDLPAKIYDTRKTTPLFRSLEKAAVVHGGGTNHRHALYDGILIKENHIQAAGGIPQALENAKSGNHQSMKIEIEVQNLEECELAVQHEPDIIMLDNMSNDDMAKAVKLAYDKSIAFEASGNVNLQTVRAIAETGVDIISVGALTHSAPAADVSLLITQ
jgi:nicotinate-nucleotide pyrophosphorylase (carboxylating)